MEGPFVLVQKDSPSYAYEHLTDPSLPVHWAVLVVGWFKPSASLYGYFTANLKGHFTHKFKSCISWTSINLFMFTCHCVWNVEVGCISSTPSESKLSPQIIYIIVVRKAGQLGFNSCQKSLRKSLLVNVFMISHVLTVEQILALQWLCPLWRGFHQSWCI